MASLNRPIRLLISTEIDKKRWNACISTNKGLIYNLYEYIDTLAEAWSGIIVGDYECVIAFPWKRKYGIKYTPILPFLQQLSLVGKYSEQELEIIVGVLNKEIKYGDYNLSEHLLSHSIARIRTNMVLSLTTSYASIKENYSVHLRQKIKKAVKNNLVVDSCLPQLVLDAFASQYKEKIGIVSTKHYPRFRLLVILLSKMDRVFAYKVMKEERLLACAIFFIYENRIYNILPCTLSEGKPYAAMHFLIDQVIQKKVGVNSVFDFEGSDLPGVKKFYQQFNPTEENYYQYHINTLPFPLNKLLG